MLQLAIYSVVARLPTVEQFIAPARPKPIPITTRSCLRLLIPDMNACVTHLVIKMLCVASEVLQFLGEK